MGIWAGGEELAMRDLLIHIFASVLYDFRSFKVRKKALCAEYLFGRYAKDLPVREIAEVFLNRVKEKELVENDMSINRMICALIVQYKRLQQGRLIDEDRPVYFISDEGERLKDLAEDLAA